MTTRTRLFLVVSLLIASTDALFVWINYRAEQARYQSFLEQRASYLGSLFAAELDNTALRMQQTAAYIASIEEVQQAFRIGRDAVEQEGGGRGGARAQAARDQLMSLVSHPWEVLQRLYGTRQLHFQFGEHATSFLRVHKPDEFGDDLEDVRFTILDALQQQEPTMGFECGRVVCGIRGVVPVSAESEPGSGQFEPVGVLEAGTSYRSLLELVENSSAAHFAVLLDLDYLQATFWPHHLDELLQKSPAVGSHVIESALNPQIHQLLARPCVQSLLYTQGVGRCLVDGRDIAIAAYSLRDYRGQQDPGLAPVGTVLAWYDTTSDSERVRRDLQVNILYAIVVLMLVEGLLFLAFRTVTRRLEQIIADQTHELHELTIHDQLTGLYNRRHLETCFEKESARVRRKLTTHLSLAMVDIDHFKSINDRFGHATGDEVLSDVAQLLQRSVRATDDVFRFGGEEFVVFLPETPLEPAVMVCDRLRNALATATLATLPTGAITASFGVAELTASGCSTTEELLNLADQALYRAKSNGRNRVEGLAPTAAD